jgi:hypothetical protein
MGAAIVRGRDIALQKSTAHDGGEFLELVPIEGGYESASYSSVATVIKACEGRGVPADVWPVYYGVDDRDVPLAEVREKCNALRAALTALPPGDLGQHRWLQQVWDWLTSDQIFCVME